MLCIYIFCVWDEIKLSNNQIILSKKEGKRRDCNNIIYKQLNLRQQQLSISLIQSSSTACMVLINSVNKKTPSSMITTFLFSSFLPLSDSISIFSFFFCCLNWPGSWCLLELQVISIFSLITSIGHHLQHIIEVIQALSYIPTPKVFTFMIIPLKNNTSGASPRQNYWLHGSVIIIGYLVN